MSRTSSRLFLALRPSDEIIAELHQACTGVRSELADLKGSAGIRWIPTERWHVTVLFVGPVNRDRMDAVTEACASTVGVADAFTWSLAGCRASPSSSMPRVLWLPVQSSGDSLDRLHRSVRRAVAAVGQPLERRRYQPHLTLARVRDRTSDTRDAARRVVRSLEGFRSSSTEATGALLLQSDLGPSPRYDELARWSFRG